MGASGVVLGGILILVLALLFGWVFLEVVIGLATALAVVMGIIFIAIIMAAGIGVAKALAG